MSWIEHHENSERLASQAQVAAREGRQDDALALYARAADAEDRALADLDTSKTRTLGITAVSAASLHYKANRLDRAMAVAIRWLNFKLPAFADVQLRSLLQELVVDPAVMGSALVEFTIPLRGIVRPGVRGKRKQVADSAVMGSAPVKFTIPLWGGIVRPGVRGKRKRVADSTVSAVMDSASVKFTIPLRSGIVRPGKVKMVRDKQTAVAMDKEEEAIFGRIRIVLPGAGGLIEVVGDEQTAEAVKGTSRKRPR